MGHKYLYVEVNCTSTRLNNVKREMKLLQQRMSALEEKCDDTDLKSLSQDLIRQLSSKDDTIASLNRKLQRMKLRAEQAETELLTHQKKV